MKPFSQACENNRKPILSILRRVFKNSRHVLEIGSGTGQHAVFFAAKMPHLCWHTSDLPTNHSGINLWINDYPHNNLRRPISLDVSRDNWASDIDKPDEGFDAVFSANTLHIMSWPQVQQLFSKLPATIRRNALVAIYGPFNYSGDYTSESNKQFDAWLQSRHPEMAIRDIEQVNQLAHCNGFKLLEDNAMPANNRLIIWQFSPQ